MATHYKLLFRGAVLSDQHPAVVRGRLQALLKGSDAQMELMFSGQPVTIKKAVDEPTAERYLDAFLKAGAKLELVQVAAPVEQPTAPAVPSEAPDAESNPASEPATAATDSTSSFGLAAPGADLVAPEERQVETPVVVPTDHLTLASAGTPLIPESAAAPVSAPEVDVSHLQLDQPGVRLGVPAPDVPLHETLLEFDFELGEVGETLGDGTPQEEVAPPEVSHLSLAPSEPEQPA